MSDAAQLESSDRSERMLGISSSPADSNRTPIMGRREWQNAEALYSKGFKSFDASAISVAVDPVALITTECITVTSAMRKHARWAHSSVSAILGGSSSPSNPARQGSQPATPGDDFNSSKKHKAQMSLNEADEEGGLANRWGLRGKKGKSMQDNPLMAGFGRLRRELVGCKGL